MLPKRFLHSELAKVLKGKTNEIDINDVVQKLRTSTEEIMPIIQAFEANQFVEVFEKNSKTYIRVLEKANQKGSNITPAEIRATFRLE